MVNAQVGCTIEFDVEEPAELALRVAVARRPGLRVDDGFDARLDGRVLDVTVLVGGVLVGPALGDAVHVVHVPAGRLRVDYTGRVAAVPADAAPERVDPLQRIAALRPSRYCPSDRLGGFARQFAPFAPQDPAAVAEAVAAIVAYVGEHTSYRAGVSGPSTDAADTLLAGAGVCRDFAHLVAGLARAVNIPARVAAVYAPGLSPMDFHSVVEVAVDEVWRVVDATGLAPRQGLVRIATGADAADTAFATVLSGRAELSNLEVRAVVDGDLPTDDGRSPVHLP